MNKNSNTYIILYATALIVIVALILSVAATVLKSRQRANVENEMKSAILLSIGEGAGVKSAQEIDRLYDKYIVERIAIDSKGDVVEGEDAFELLKSLKHHYAKPEQERVLPLFVSKDDAEVVRYVIPLWGSGLWGAIWGYLALESDWKTISGVQFDHSGETPGLGGEISTPHFQDEFDGKTIFKNGNLVGIEVLKGVGSSAGNDNAVDALSGGTITSRGVESMLKNNLSNYEAYINKRIEEIDAKAKAEVEAQRVEQEQEQGDEQIKVEDNG